ncbi:MULTISPECIES: hypothetical protein [Pseudidiomarina]|nr:MULTISPECIES: hypothetical protein [Pseudidiomarina]
MMYNAKHTGDDRVAVGIPAGAGRECCVLLAFLYDNTENTRPDN